MPSPIVIFVNKILLPLLDRDFPSPATVDPIHYHHAVEFTKKRGHIKKQSWKWGECDKRQSIQGELQWR